MVVPIGWRPPLEAATKAQEEHELLARDLEKRIANNWWAWGAILLLFLVDWLLYAAIKNWADTQLAQAIAVTVAFLGVIPAGLLGEAVHEMFMEEE